MFAQLMSLPVALAIAIMSIGAIAAAPEPSHPELVMAKAAKKSPPRGQEKVSTGSSGDVPIPPWLLKAKRSRS